MLKSKDIKKSEGGGWEIQGVPDRGFPSREAARQYIRAENIANRLNNNITKVTDTIQKTREIIHNTHKVINRASQIADNTTFIGAPQNDFQEVDPFSKAEAQWAKDLVGDPTVN